MCTYKTMPPAHLHRHSYLSKSDRCESHWFSSQVHRTCIFPHLMCFVVRAGEVDICFCSSPRPLHASRSQTSVLTLLSVVSPHNSARAGNLRQVVHTMCWHNIVVVVTASENSVQLIATMNQYPWTNRDAQTLW